MRLLLMESLSRRQRRRRRRGGDRRVLSTIGVTNNLPSLIVKSAAWCLASAGSGRQGAGARHGEGVPVLVVRAGEQDREQGGVAGHISLGRLHLPDISISHYL